MVVTQTLTPIFYFIPSFILSHLLFLRLCFCFCHCVCFCLRP